MPEMSTVSIHEASESVEFAAQELLEAPSDERLAILERFAKSLTRWLLQDNPDVGIYEVSHRVRQFMVAVRRRVEEEERRLQEEW
jgi:hypothetical protein